MPPSMRQQTAKLKAAQSRREDLQLRRRKATELIQAHHTITDVAAVTSISERTLYRIRKAIKKDQIQTLNRLLTPTEHHAGRTPVLTRSEEQMLVDRTIFASERAFTMGEHELRSMMGQNANDGRKTFKNGLPCIYALRSFRSRNRQLTMRRTENIVLKRINAQNTEHLQTLVDIIERVKEKMPDPFTDPRKVWNLDETAVSASYGRRYRGFNAANRRNGGLRMKMKDGGKHLTSVIISCAAGHIAPMFLIVQGKRPVKSWMNPTPQHITDKLHDDYKWLAERKWIPTGTALVCSKKGSITKEILPKVIAHFNNFVRKFVPQDEKILLYIDGHSSRKGTEWIEVAVAKKIEVIQLPANTSHFLQPCDDHINKVYKENVRNALDVFSYKGAYLNANISVKMKLAAAAYRSLNANLAVRSFFKCGLYPLDTDKIMKFAKSPRPEPEPGTQLNLPAAGSSRLADDAIATEVRRIAREVMSSSDCLRQIENVLQQNPSANSVIWRPAPVITPTKAKPNTNPGGTPALWLTEGIRPFNSPNDVNGTHNGSGFGVGAQDKENDGQGGDMNFPTLVESNARKEFDDLPIAMWPRRAKNTVDGCPRSSAQHEAASVLMAIRHYR